MVNKRMYAIFSLLGFVFLVLILCKGREKDASDQRLAKDKYKSNGEQIYFTAKSQRGNPISFEMMGMMHMRTNHMACVDCYSRDGKGKTVQMMMGSFKAPDIRYSTLTPPEHVHEEGEEETRVHDMDHLPYTIETIKRAITQGIDPAGHPLNIFMPRWRISDEDPDDLLNFLKSLD